MWNILRIVLALSGTGITGMLGVGAIVLTLDRIFKVSYGFIRSLLALGTIVVVGVSIYVAWTLI